MKRYLVTGLIIIICFILQTTIFKALSFASISPNLLISITAANGFMRGKKDGMWVGFISGLLIDIVFGSVIGFYALTYMVIGYLNGFLHVMFFPEDIKLPIFLIGLSDLISGFVVYFFLFLFRGKFEFGFYFQRIIIPELIYTVLVSIFLYLIVLKIDQTLQTEEKKAH